MIPFYQRFQLKTDALLAATQTEGANTARLGTGANAALKTSHNLTNNRIEKNTNRNIATGNTSYGSISIQKTVFTGCKSHITDECLIKLDNASAPFCRAPAPT